ncbi:hypothetical protein JCM16418A_42190 [Paenibacillus pini]
MTTSVFASVIGFERLYVSFVVTSAALTGIAEINNAETHIDEMATFLNLFKNTQNTLSRIIFTIKIYIMDILP